jgi:hypothetical protein
MLAVFAIAVLDRLEAANQARGAAQAATATAG